MFCKTTIILLFLFLSGCSFFEPSPARIRIAGSDTMLLLVKKLSAEYMRAHPGVAIYVEGGGTAKGLEKLSKGKIDICMASRSVRPGEAKKMADEFGLLGMSFLIAKDALSVYLNPENPVKDLSMEELKRIFTCDITNWNEAGGDKAPVEVITRSPNSGTHLYFKQHILEGEEYCEKASIAYSTQNVIELVSMNKYAAGYGGIAYGDSVYHAKINGFAPNSENIINNKYPIIRYLQFYTLNIPKGRVKEFIDWVLSPEGQEIVAETGYHPLFLRN
ncbi:MAG: phosphate ABC transporter substrate-binding protein [Candidatus Kapaibacterium sp.]